MITTEKLSSAGLTALDQAQRCYVRSVRTRLVALFLLALAIVVALPLTTDPRIAWIVWTGVVVFFAAGIWQWHRSTRSRPPGWPGLRDSISLYFGGRFKRSR